MHREQVNIHCPFCHHKGSYPNDPAGSTLRCHECKAVFRMPAVKHRRRGEAIRGERMRTGAGRNVLLLVIILGLVGVGGYYAYSFIANRGGDDGKIEGDPFPDVLDLEPENTAKGVVQRFLLSWKRGDMKLILHYVRDQDREAAENDSDQMDRLKDHYIENQLVDYELGEWQWVDFKRKDAVEWVVQVKSTNKRSTLTREGSMKIRIDLVSPPDSPDEVWRVELGTAVPDYRS